MLDPRRHAAALLAALLLTAPAPALALEPTLLAQIEDVTPTPTPEDQPSLSEDPPSQLGSGGEKDDEAKSDDDSSGTGGEPAASDREPLPETGIEAGLVALLGLGLIASGSGLRLTLGRDAR